MTFVLLALFGSSAWAQTRRISGRVTVEGTTDPIPAATVSVVGTTLGAITGDDGRFSVSAPAGPVTLRVRRIGYTPRTLPVGAGLTEVTAALARDVLELDRQVITGTATTVAQVNAANAVAVVSGERLSRVQAQTIDNALQGKVPGAVISSNNGAPGGGTQIQLRGVSTINAGFTPLYVVDGVIVSNASIPNAVNVITQAARSGGVANAASSQDQQVNRIADLNPNDIESIQVLKGPSASSIYGSKGTNGVIVITTKQGRAGKTTLDISQRLGTYTLANKIGPFFCFTSAEGADDQGFLGGGDDGKLFTAAGEKCHDYEEEFYGNESLSYQTVASIRGSTSSGTNFFVSGLAQRDNGLALNDFYNKQSMRINLGQQVGGRLNVRANTEIIHTLTQRGVSGNDNTGINPYTTFSATPSFVDLRRNADGTFPRNPQNAVGNSNPFQNADAIKTPENVYRLIGSLTGTYNLLTSQSQTLDLSMTGGVDAFNDVAKVISPAFLYVEQVNSNPGTLATTSSSFVNANLNGSLAHRLIRSGFTATTSAGFRQDRRQFDITTVIGRGVIPGVQSVDQAVQNFVAENQGLVKDFTLFAQEEFLTFGERLLFTAGVNAERSSNNGDDTKFYAYPKFSASYRIPEVIPRVNEFKVRLAYGRAGNQPTQGKFTFLTTLFNEGVAGLRNSTAKGFAGIQPEVASELEGGFDVQAFDGRMRFSATQFRKQIDNLLLQTVLAPSTGFTSQFINGGQIVNHGTELELGLTPVQTGRFEWTSNTTYASVAGKVTRLPASVPAFIPVSGSFGSRFGNGFIQVGQSPSVVQAVNSCAVAVAPRSASAPFGGNCPAASRILSFVGDALPDYTMGFSNDFTLGAIRLSTLVDWRKGGKAINLTNNYFDGGLLGDSALGNARLTSFRSGRAAYVEDAGFVKLREVSVAYELPSGLTNRLFNGRAERARIEFSGRNLLTSTKYTGLDPEVSNFGNVAVGRLQDVTPYPPSRSFFFSVNTTF